MKITTKVFKNNDGLFRVKVYGYMDMAGKGRWMLDEDLMMAVISSHRSKELTFTSEESANRAIAQFYDLRSRIMPMFTDKKEIVVPVYSDTWRELDSSDPKAKEHLSIFDRIKKTIGKYGK